MDFITLLVDVLRDPKKGPHVILGFLGFWFLWILIMQGINAELWHVDFNLHDGSSTYEEAK